MRQMNNRKYIDINIYKEMDIYIYIYIYIYYLKKNEF